MKYKYQLNKLCAVAGALLLLTFTPRAGFAAVSVNIWLDIITNYPGITYAAARAEVQSILSGGARWGVIGWTLSTNISGAKFNNYPGGQAYCVEGTYVVSPTTRTNYYVPVQPVVNFTTDTNFYYYYIPYSNTLSITASGPASPVAWTLSGPTEFANSTAYRTSGSGSVDLVAVPTGTYSVAALPGVRGYATPTATSTNITGASPLVNTLALVYTAYSNNLAVTVSGITSGSNCVWTLAGPVEFGNAISFGTVFTNTFTVTAIPTGFYTITFPAVVGYTTPDAVATNITDASPLINNMTGSYVSVIWGPSTNPPTPAPTNFPVFTNDITLMVDTNGLFKTPSREKIIEANGLLTNGAVGPQGPEGPTGAMGAQGPQGLPGTNGVDGATGPQGPAGTNGADGATGSQGPAGTNGAVGPQGPQGSAGSNGVAGATGPQGIPGPAGTNGVDGAQGPQVRKGIMEMWDRKARQERTELTAQRGHRARPEPMAWMVSKDQRERMEWMALTEQTEQLVRRDRKVLPARTVLMVQLALRDQQARTVLMAQRDRQAQTVLMVLRVHRVRQEQMEHQGKSVRKAQPVLLAQ